MTSGHGLVDKSIILPGHNLRLKGAAGHNCRDTECRRGNDISIVPGWTFEYVLENDTGRAKLKGSLITSMGSPRGPDVVPVSRS